MTDAPAPITATAASQYIQAASRADNAHHPVAETRVLLTLKVVWKSLMDSPVGLKGTLVVSCRGTAVQWGGGGWVLTQPHPSTAGGGLTCLAMAAGHHHLPVDLAWPAGQSRQ